MPPPTRTRRGVTLAEQMAASSNLRDLLKLRDNDDDDDDGGRKQDASFGKNSIAMPRRRGDRGDRARSLAARN